MEKPVTFIEEMLQEAEERELQQRLELNLQQCNEALSVVAKLTVEMNRVNNLADEEMRLVEKYRKSESQRIDKKRQWLLLQIEGFLRRHHSETGEKTVRLVKGQVSLRKSKDRIEVTNPDVFEKVGERLGLFRLVPGKKEPDLQAIAAAIKIQGSIPGVTVIPGSINFHYSIHTNGSNNHEQTESSET